MATYRTTIESPHDVATVFAYLSDLRTIAEWDPGVRRAVQVQGDGPGPDAAYDVTVEGFVGDLELRYEVLDIQAPERFVIRADTRMLTSLDEMVVTPVEGGGSRLTYDAELSLKGPLHLVDKVLSRAFDRIGDRAADGLRKALTGPRVGSSG